MARLTAVDYDPFASGPSLTPVDYDPFAPTLNARASGSAGAVNKKAEAIWGGSFDDWKKRKEADDAERARMVAESEAGNVGSRRAQEFQRETATLAETGALRNKPGEFNFGATGQMMRAGAERAIGGALRFAGESAAPVVGLMDAARNPEAFVRGTTDRGEIPSNAVLAAGQDNALANVGSELAATGATRARRAQPLLIDRPDDALSVDGLKYYAQQGAISAPQLATTVAAGYLGGPAAALLAAGGTAFGTKFADSRDENQDFSQAARGALVTATNEAIPEMLPAAAALGKLSRFMPDWMADGIVSRLIATGAAEGSTEGITEAANIAYETFGENKPMDRTTFVNRVKDAVITGGLAGSMVGAVTGTAEYGQARDEVRDDAMIRSLRAAIKPRATTARILGPAATPDAAAGAQIADDAFRAAGVGTVAAADMAEQDALARDLDAAQLDQLGSEAEIDRLLTGNAPRERTDLYRASIPGAIPQGMQVTSNQDAFAAPGTIGGRDAPAPIQVTTLADRSVFVPGDPAAIRQKLADAGSQWQGMAREIDGVQGVRFGRNAWPEVQGVVGGRSVDNVEPEAGGQSAPVGGDSGRAPPPSAGDSGPVPQGTGGLRDPAVYAGAEPTQAEAAVDERVGSTIRPTGDVPASMDSVVDSGFQVGLSGPTAGVRDQQGATPAPTALRDLTDDPAIRAFDDIRPPKENLSRVASALSNSTKVIGNRTVSIESLTGGVGDEVTDNSRVKSLARKLAKPGAYFERLIVDQDGNVIEGQHRLDALRMIGAKSVPVVVIRDFEAGFPTVEVTNAMQSAQSMRSDNANRMAALLAEIYADESGDIAEVAKYDPPAGFESAWAAGVAALRSSVQSDITATASDSGNVGDLLQGSSGESAPSGNPRGVGDAIQVGPMEAPNDARPRDAGVDSGGTGAGDRSAGGVSGEGRSLGRDAGPVADSRRMGVEAGSGAEPVRAGTDEVGGERGTEPASKVRVRDDGAQTGASVDTARTAISQALGSKHLQRLDSRKTAGGLKLYNLVEDFAGLPSDVKARIDRPESAAAFVLPDGRIFIIANRVTDNPVGVHVHELGVHLGMRGILGADFPAVLRNFKRQRAKDAAVGQAYERATEAAERGEDGELTADALATLDEEALAYYVEANWDAKDARGIVAKVIDAIKSLLNRLGIPLSTLNASPELLRNVAIGAARKAADGRVSAVKDGALVYARDLLGEAPSETAQLVAQWKAKVDAKLRGDGRAYVKPSEGPGDLFGGPVEETSGLFAKPQQRAQGSLFSRRAKFEPWKGTVEAGTVLYHGSPGELDPTRDTPLYLSDRKSDAGAYAVGLIPGTGKGQKGKPQIIKFIVSDDARVLDANIRINDAVMDMTEETADEAIDGAIAQAKREGYDFVWFEHPSVDGDEMNALIAVDWRNILLEDDGDFHSDYATKPKYSRRADGGGVGGVKTLADLRPEITDAEPEFDANYAPKDDEYLYHVTSEPAAKAIAANGFKPASKMFGHGAYAKYSDGRVFFTERSGLNFWKERVENQLFDKFDDPPDVAVVRVKRSDVEGMIEPDKTGSDDARRPAYFIATNRQAPPREGLGASGPKYSRAPTITINGTERPMTDSTGKAIHPLRKFSGEEITTAGGFEMDPDKVAEDGDDGQSPWLMADGKIIGTGQDHIGFAEQLADAPDYSIFMGETGAVRAGMFTRRNGDYVVTLHTHEGQEFTPQQIETLRSIEARRGKITVMHGVANGLVNPQYAQKSIGELPQQRAPKYSRSTITIDGTERPPAERLFREYMRGDLAQESFKTHIARQLRGEKFDYEIRAVPVDDVTPSQFGEDYNNESSRETARRIADGSVLDARPEDVYPIEIDASGKIVDGNHRHAAAVMNGDKTILALVPVTSGSGKVINTGAFSPTDKRIAYSRKTEEPEGLPPPVAIESHLSNMLKLRAFFDSAVDVMARQPGLKPLADAVRSYFDNVRRRQGLVNEVLRAPVKAASKADLDAFERYQYALQNNLRDDVAEELAGMTDKGRALVSAWEKIAKLTNDENQKVGVQVFDPKIGGWRKIGTARNFFPRVLKPMFQEAMRQPHKYPTEWNRLVRILLDAGRIQSAEDAQEFLNTAFSNESAFEYFAGIEKARMEPLPRDLYDYSMDAAIGYKDAWADRLSQIEAFGQKIGQGDQAKDKFDEVLMTVTDDNTRNYVTRVRERITNTNSKSPFYKFMANMNTLVTGLMLGNPATAALNIVGGLSNNAMVFPLGPNLRALKELRNLGAGIRDAVAKGVLIDDYMGVSADAAAQGVSERLSNLTQGLLNWGGYNGTEYINRVHSMLVGKHFLSDSLAAINKNPRSRKSLLATAFLQRNGFDIDTLAAESTKPADERPETNKFLRFASNLTQGSYKIDQTPIFVDEPIGKFLFKYQKFGTQINRVFYQQVLKPFVQSVFKGGEPITLKNADGTEAQERVRNFVPLLRFIAGAIPGGMLVQFIREALFGYGEDGPDEDEIRRKLADGETAAAAAMLAERAFIAITALGAGGFLGNYMQTAKDFQERQRFKNPLDPPGLAPVKSFANFVMKLNDQGKITLDDIEQEIQNNVSLYRTGKRLLSSGINMVNDESVTFAAREAARREHNHVRYMARRYADSVGIEAKRRAPSEIAATANTPTNRAIKDALLLGDGETARALAAEYVASFDNAYDAANALASIRNSIRLGQPALVQLAPSETERRRFMRWAFSNLTPEGYARIKDTDEKYRKAAASSGLWKPESDAAAMKRDRKADESKAQWSDSQRNSFLRSKGLKR